MRVLSSFIIACSMYSRIPMPKIAWTKDNMKYVMCCFPFIGIVIGGGLIGWLKLSGILQLSTMGYAFIGTALPLIITGGIHMDGFLDTIDALSSYESKERKLEILKDPHAGAFAIIACGVYLLLYSGLFSELEATQLSVFCCSFVITRSLSGLSVVLFPCAKNSGLAATFQKQADRKIAGILMILYMVVTTAIIIYLDPIVGLAAVGTACVLFFYYYKVSKTKFGGITGDLAGYFLQITELGILAAIVVVGKWLEVAA